MTGECCSEEMAPVRLSDIIKVVMPLRRKDGLPGQF